MITFLLISDIWVQGIQIAESLAILVIAVLAYRRERK